MNQVWTSEIASLRDQASRRSGFVVCTADAYMALVDGARIYWGAKRLDRLNGTNHAEGLSPDGKYLGRVCRNIDDVRTFSEEEARRLSTEMAWASACALASVSGSEDMGLETWWSNPGS